MKNNEESQQFSERYFISPEYITDIDEDNIEHYCAPLLVGVLEEDLQ